MKKLLALALVACGDVHIAPQEVRAERAPDGTIALTITVVATGELAWPDGYYKYIGADVIHTLSP